MTDIVSTNLVVFPDKERFERFNDKLHRDFLQNGVMSKSPRMKPSGIYAHTLGVVEDAPDGQMNIFSIRQGPYAEGQADGKPVWSQDTIIYWLRESDEHGVNSIQFQRIVANDKPSIILKAVSKESKEIQLTPELVDQYLEKILQDFEMAKPNHNKTDKVILQSNKRQSVETEWINTQDASSPYLLQ